MIVNREKSARIGSLLQRAYRTARQYDRALTVKKMQEEGEITHPTVYQRLTEGR